MTMTATVLNVRQDGLLVRNQRTGQEVQVHTRLARRFRRGDRVLIVYNGIMTMSLPPQITATRIVRLPPCNCR